MRSFVGFAMLVAAGLGGIEYVTQTMPSLMPAGEPLLQAALVDGSAAGAHAIKAAPLPAIPAPTFGGVVQTVAASDSPSLPPVNVAPQAPRAAPIEPIVAPVQRAATKPAQAKSAVVRPAMTKAATAKAKPSKTPHAKPVKVAKLPPGAAGVTVTRPGFKLTCTSTQKLDPVKQRCLPVKTASAKKTKS